MNIEQKYLDRVRDIFCFCAATSLRYSDVKNLKWSNVKDEAIEITTVKTDDLLRIPLNEYSGKILEKYRGSALLTANCFPVISNQKYNEYLKKLGRLAGFNSLETIVSYHERYRIERTYPKWELMTSHVARKTFVTMGVLLEIPAEVLMTFTGHKTHEMMERYYSINSKEKIRFMNRINEIGSSKKRANE